MVPSARYGDVSPTHVCQILQSHVVAAFVNRKRKIVLVVHAEVQFRVYIVEIQRVILVFVCTFQEKVEIRASCCKDKR